MKDLLAKLEHAAEAGQEITLTIDDKTQRFIPKIPVSGQNKQVIELDKHFNLLVPAERFLKRFGEAASEKWKNHVVKEAAAYTDAKKQGLLTQEAQLVKLEDGQDIIPSLRVCSFDYLQERGIQVRDTNRSAESKGGTKVFTSREQVNPEYCLSIMGDVINDAAKMLAAGFPFGQETINLAVTHAYHPQQGNVRPPEHIGDGGTLRLFVFDFPDIALEPAYPAKHVTDVNGAPDPEGIASASKQMANFVSVAIGGIFTSDSPAINRDLASKNKDIIHYVSQESIRLQNALTPLLAERIAEATLRRMENTPQSLRIAHQRRSRPPSEIT